jgi:hypothetical protein
MTCMRAALLLLAAGALLLTGCAGYRLGPVGDAPGRNRTVEVHPFANQTLEPFLTDALTSQVIKEFQRDGTVRVARPGEGDIVVSGTISDYRRVELTSSKADLLTVSDYRVTLTAEVTARERGSDKVIFSKPISGFTLVRVGDDLVGAERQALPLLAEDLARNIVSLLAEGGW